MLAVLICLFWTSRLYVQILPATRLSFTELCVILCLNNMLTCMYSKMSVFLHNLRAAACLNNALALPLACINKIVIRHSDDLLLKKFIGSINNARSDLFWFVPSLDIQTTNNAAERGLHKIVVHRKAWGGIRTEEIGMDGKFLFVYHSMEEQGIKPYSRDCKIRLKSGQTT